MPDSLGSHRRRSVFLAVAAQVHCVRFHTLASPGFVVVAALAVEAGTVESRVSAAVAPNYFPLPAAAHGISASRKLRHLAEEMLQHRRDPETVEKAAAYETNFAPRRDEHFLPPPWWPVAWRVVPLIPH